METYDADVTKLYLPIFALYIIAYIHYYSEHILSFHSMYFIFTFH